MAIFQSGGSKDNSDAPKRRASDMMPLSIIAHDLSVTGDLEAEGVVKIERSEEHRSELQSPI